MSARISPRRFAPFSSLQRSGHARRLGLALGFFFVWMFGLGSCARRPSLVVTLPNVPASAATLSVLLSSDEKPTLESPRFDVAGRGGGKEFVYTFGVYPPVDTSGMLLVSVGVYDGSGCLVTTGAARTELSAAVSEYDLTVTLDAPAAEYAMGCRSSTPVIRSFAQNDNQPTQITITGWGFSPGVTVILDGKPLTALTRTDHTRIEATTPLAPSPSGVRRVDLQVKNSDGASATASVLLYTLTFASRAENSYPLMASREPITLAVGDVDKDGKLDIVTGGFFNTVSGFVAIYRNQGGGKFSAMPELIDLPGSVDYLTLADLNGDTQLDIALSSQNTDRVYVLYNQGGGTFLKTGIPSFPAGQFPGPIGVGDFIGDSKPDIVVGSQGVTLSGSLSVLQNLGSSFPNTTPPRVDLTGTVLNDMLIRDLNKDGVADIVVSYVTAGAPPNVFASEVLPLFPTDRNFNFGTTGLLDNVGALTTLQTPDVNGDSYPDIVASGFYSLAQGANSRLSLFFNRMNSTFTQPTSEVPSRTSPFSMAVGDFNLDGREDLVVTHPIKEGQGTLTVSLNQGGPTYFPAAELPVYPLAFGDTNVAAGDLNGDGKPDFVVTSRGTAKLQQLPVMQVFLNTSP